MNDITTIREMEDMRPILARTVRPIVLVVTDGDTTFSGPVLEGVFGYRLGIGTPGITRIIRDFREYEAAHNRTPLVFILDGLSLPGENALNPDPEWVVHSTDRTAGRAILAEGRLLSRSLLRASGAAFRSFGREALGEPPDYADLINFAPLDSHGPEIVVASKEHERFCSADEPYCPGVRFYFTVSSLRRQAGYTRFMGGHAVRNRLSLDWAEYCTIKPEDLPERASWTPAAYTEEANRKFRQMAAPNGR